MYFIISNTTSTEFVKYFSDDMTYAHWTSDINKAAIINKKDLTEFLFVNGNFKFIEVLRATQIINTCEKMGVS